MSLPNCLQAKTEIYRPAVAGSFILPVRIFCPAHCISFPRQSSSLTMDCFQSNVLQDRVAVITGGGSGICQGIAQAYAHHGAHVAVIGRKQENLDQTVASLQGVPGKVIGLAADVRDTSKVEQVIQTIANTLGSVDIVINGAAGNFLAPVAQLSSNGFKTVIDIDLIGTYNLCKATFPYLQASRHQPTIINISATLHYGGTPMQSHVSAAKAGIDALTRNLAVEWGPVGIRTNAIAPGPIDDTEGIRRLVSPELRQKMLQRMPLQRFGQINDIAQAAIFLASPAASFINGAILVVDGGTWLNNQAMGDFWS